MAYFNPFRPSFFADPYPALRRLRDEEPVHYSRGIGAWVVTGYAECAEVLRDHGRFSSLKVDRLPDGSPLPTAEWQSAVFGDLTGMVDADPPLHTKLRNAINRSLTPRAVEALRGYIETAAVRLFEGAAPGPFDLMSGVAKRLPLETKLEYLDIPSDERPKVLDTARVVMDAMDPTSPPDVLDRARAARDWLLDYLDRREAPELAAATGEGVLTREETLSVKVDALVAGNDDTSYGIGSCIHSLLTHPDQLEILRREPELIPGAVHELMRFDNPSHVALRHAAEDTTLAGRRVAAGQPIFVMIAGANRDPREFEDPDRLDVRRDARRQLGFATGIHYCLGSPLASLEMSIVLREFLRRFRRPALLADQTQLGGNFILRGFSRLTVVEGD